MENCDDSAREIVWKAWGREMVMPFRLAGLVAVSALLLVNPQLARAQALRGEAEAKQPSRTVGIVLFPQFEMLDAAGPMEVFGNLRNQVTLVTVAKSKDAVPSAQGPRIMPDHSFADCPKLDLLLVPGGFGVARVLGDEESIQWVTQRSREAEITMSVCNGASILAKCGILDARPATTNKAYWDMATRPGPDVKWVRHARWVDDGNVVTSSGVSAGIDMSLAVVQRLYGEKRAVRIAEQMEYEWHRDASWDPFAEIHAPKAK